ncbi:MAG: thiolase domain-containing protein [Dehalococcoidia bacterium]
MREVAVVAFAQAPSFSPDAERNEVEMLAPVVREALDRAGLSIQEIGFVMSGSCDYLAGQPFAFVTALDAVGLWPPKQESHVEQDGAWALYEAWVRMQHDEIDSALVYAFGKSSLGSIRDVLTLQLDPYYVAPLWPDTHAIAALQARALLEGSDYTERDMAAVAARGRRDATIDELLTLPYVASPLREHDCPPVSDGAAAVVLAAGNLAREICERPAWIRGIDHRIEPQGLGLRDLARSTSAALAARHVGAGNGPIDVAELHASYTHQELILREAMGLGAGVAINPSGGALAADPVMVTGLIRIGEAASRIMSGEAKRALAHASAGPCLQQNLVCVMEAA